MKLACIAALVMVATATEVEGYPDHLGEMFPCTETTGINIRNPDNSWSTAMSTNPRTGLVPENASTHGSAEDLDNVKVKDGAMVTTLAKRSTSDQIACLQPGCEHPRSFRFK